jgi:GNAT superfamily N-acetyltransferase
VPARIASGGLDGATVRAVLDGLNAFNTDAAGPGGHADLILSVFRDGGAEPVGGLIGHVGFGWLFVRLFFLPEDLRGQGLGKELLRRAEDEARARGCVGAHLDTFGFQARGFYEKQGYAVFGTLPDCPPGHSRFFQSKRLDAPPPPA